MTDIEKSNTRPDGGYAIGVDVGTASARAGVFTLDGRLVGYARQDITLHRDTGGYVEQSSSEIWQAVATAVRGAVAKSGVRTEDIAGLGFDATCSLVVLDEDGAGLPVGSADRLDRDIIVWMDHRAVEQARRINEGRHDVLKYVGGVISPEMEMPKLLWLKENRRSVFDRARQFFDLTDFLTWKATGSTARSSCTVTCKWNYVGHEGRWDQDYLRAIGLEELAGRNFERIGSLIVAPGEALANGLTEAAAEDLDLVPGTPVAAGLIDAHAGGIGTVGAIGEPTQNLAYVFGTSSCTMTTTTHPVFVPGVWGPYYSAMVPGFWLNEGGQSAAGAAIDHLLRLHPATEEAKVCAEAAGIDFLNWLSLEAEAAVKTNARFDVADLAGGLHVVPEFIGNRAPYADPQARAVIAGLGMEDDLQNLIALYIAGLCGLFYGLRQIVEVQASRGVQVERIIVSGGAGQSRLVCQLIADATGKPVVVGASEEPVLLGSAMLGTVAGGAYRDIPAAMHSMSSSQMLIEPAGGRVGDAHEARYAAFQRLQSVAREIQVAPGT